MNIDLGKKCGSDCPVPMDSKETKDKVYYPSLYLEGSSDLKGLPESGELTIRYKRVSLSTRERDGEKSTSVELEVRQITDAKGGDAETEKSGEDALDDLRRESDDDYESKD